MVAANAKAETVSSRKKLAAKLQVTERTVENWSKHPQWKFGKGPYDPKRVKAWSEKHLRRSRNPNSKSKSVNGRDPAGMEADQLLKQRRAEWLQLKIDKEKGLLIPRTDNHDAMMALTNLFVRECENWVQTMPNQLQMKEAAFIEEWGVERCDTMRARLAAEISKRDNNAQ